MYLSKITNLVLSLCKLPQRLIGIAIIFGPFSIILCINLWPVAPFAFYFYSFCFFWGVFFIVQKFTVKIIEIMGSALISCKILC